MHCMNDCVRALESVAMLWRLRSNCDIIVIIIILSSVSIPEGGLKIDENKLKGYDAQSVQSDRHQAVV